MEKEILSNINHLYKSHIVTAIIFLLLGCIAVFISIGVIKFELLKSTIGRIALLILVVVCSIALLTTQIILTVPIYRDREETSYVILENATMTIVTDSTGVIDRTNQVVVVDEKGNLYNFKMQNDLQLTKDYKYSGTIVYLKHSNYVVWYSFD